MHNALPCVPEAIRRRRDLSASRIGSRDREPIRVKLRTKKRPTGAVRAATLHTGPREDRLVARLALRSGSGGIRAVVVRSLGPVHHRSDSWLAICEWSGGWSGLFAACGRVNCAVARKTRGSWIQG